MQAYMSNDPSNWITASPLKRGLMFLACGCIFLGSSQLQAQMVYRIVGADGQVTFSDKPPASLNNKSRPLDNAQSGAALNTPALPYELRQVAGKYPVTIYSSINCAPCESGRKLLIARGVPFSEKTVSTAQDVEAFQKLSGSNSVPFLTIGTQHVAGFSVLEWTQYLNAAGYPESSKLPTGFRQPPPAPLVSPDEPPTALESPIAPAQAALPPVAPPPPANNPSNPAGIQF